jgi:DUF917 family protein
LASKACHTSKPIPTGKWMISMPMDSETFQNQLVENTIKTSINIGRIMLNPKKALIHIKKYFHSYEIYKSQIKIISNPWLYLMTSF